MSNLFQRCVLSITHDNVVENLNPQELTGPDEVPSGADIRRAGCRVTAWMVVHDHDCVCTGDDSGAKHLTWMHKHRIKNSHSHNHVPFHVTASIKQKHHEALTVWIEIRIVLNVSAPILSSTSGTIAFAYH